MQNIVLLLLAGLVVFLYALNRLSANLKIAAGKGLKRLLARFTRNIITAVISGTFITVLLDSSSAVIVITIALVSAGTLSFRQALGVVMGANIGTTISSQIIAFDIGEWSAIPMAIGLIWMLVAKKERLKAAGQAIFNIGLLFFGLYVMGEGVAPLKDSVDFEAYMLRMEEPWMGVLIGMITTVLIQSSSATVGMLVKLSHEGLITLGAGIAIMMGAELGTCSDTLIATVGQNRQAVKTGIFHLVFNIVSITLGVLLIAPFTSLVQQISGGFSLAHQIAHAHILFNVFGVLLFLPFTKYFESILNRLIPEKNTITTKG